MGEKHKISVARLERRILEDVARITFQELRDPRLRFGSITKVKLSDDLRHAKIYVSCLGDEADRRTFLRALESARGKIQAMVAGHLRTRVTPQLHFTYDEGVERSVRLSKLIDEAVAADRKNQAARGEAVEAEGGRGEEE
jgi:ribosome-binding factor A